MKGAYNFVPGVLGMILMLICAMMTSVAIVREKESGTMEVLLVSLSSRCSSSFPRCALFCHLSRKPGNGPVTGRLCAGCAG
jgi:hypothetical protein